MSEWGPQHRAELQDAADRFDVLLSMETAEAALAHIDALEQHAVVFDCTVRDTSDFVRHCDTTAPCARHRAEQAEAERDEAYLVVTEDAEGTGASLVQAAEWLRDRARRFKADNARLRAALVRAQKELLYCGYSTSEGGVLFMIDAVLRATCPTCHGTGLGPDGGWNARDGSPLVCTECGR